MDERNDADPAGGVPFEHAARFVSIDSAARRFRFDELRLQATLWDGVALVRVWGRMGTTGRSAARGYPDRAAARADAERAARHPLRRGYRLVGAR